MAPGLEKGKFGRAFLFYPIQPFHATDVQTEDRQMESDFPKVTHPSEN